MSQFDALPNETIKALYARKSVRSFMDKPISEESKQLIFRAAFEAPTAGNQMLYSIIHVTDTSLKETLAQACDHQPFIAAAPLVLIFLADTRRWLDAYRAAGLTPRKPGQGDILLAMADAVIAAQNSVVAAESLGIGSCYIGDILEHCEHIRDILSLPEEVIPAAMLVYGYPTTQQAERKKPARFDGHYIVFENKYRLLSSDEHRKMYIDRETRSGKAHPVFETSMEAFWKRKYESDFSREMSRSAAIYLDTFEQR